MKNVESGINFGFDEKPPVRSADPDPGFMPFTNTPPDPSDDWAFSDLNFGAVAPDTYPNMPQKGHDTLNDDAVPFT